MNKRLLVLLLPLFTLCASADDAIEINGIYYYLGTNPNVAEVTKVSNFWYSGDIIIPETVTYEGRKYSVTSIGDCAFQNCFDLSSVTIPNSVTSIGALAFSKCTGLTSVTIPNSVTSIGSCAFQDCSSLTSVSIPNSMTKINLSTFYGCKKLTSVTIPYGLTLIDAFAFANSGLTSITIPNSVTSICNAAFQWCHLTSIIIGSGVTSIEDYVFSINGNLTDVYCMAEKVPYTFPNAFSGSFSEQTTLHVPEQSLDAYKAASPWNKFKNIVGDATGINRIHSNSVKVQQENGYITFEGVEEGTVVSVYDIKGVQIGSAIVEGGKVFIPTNLQTGSIAIVKIKDKSIKVTIK